MPITPIKHCLKKLVFVSLFIFLMGVVNFSYCQTPYFKPFTINRENTTLIVNTLFTDHVGFLWIGTNDGVYQSDGIEYSQFLLNNKKTSNEVSAIYQDRTSTIWIGYKDGSIAYLKNDSLQLLNTQEGLPKKAITAITSDSNGAVWFASAGEGVYYYLNNRIYNIDTDDGLNDNYCYTLLEDGSGKMWVGTDQGIAICDYTAKKKSNRKIKTADGLPDEIVRVLCKDVDGNICIGMEQNGLCKYNIITEKVEALSCFKNWKNGPVNDICINANEIWVATSDSGLLYCNRKQDKECLTFQSAENVKFGKVTALAKDKQQNLWISCGAGLVRSMGMWLTFLNNYNGYPINFVHTLLVDREKNLFLTPDQGLLKIPFDKKAAAQKFEFTPAADEIDIVSLYEDDAGYIWTGTMGAGLYRLNHHTGLKQKINLPDENLSVLSIAGNENEIWLGTFGGAVKIKLEDNFNKDKIQYSVTRYDKQKEIGNYYIYCVFIDSKKRVWFGSDQKGIACFSNGQFSNPYNAQLKDKTVYSIAEDKAGNIWCSIADEGAIMLGKNGVKKFGTREGIREVAISSICPLDFERIAFVHRLGLDIVNIRTGQVDYYGSENNLNNINPDLNSKTKDSDGKIWTGTEKGIVILNPALYAVVAAPQVIIKHAALYNNANNKTQQHFFRYDENALSFDYTALWFTDPSRINYQYKLEGFNDNWIDTRDKRIVFPNLAPGKYVFKVRASIQKSFANTSEASYDFYIAQPYWEQTWFRISGIILIAALVYYLIKKRDERLRRLEVLKKEKIQFQFETLRNQVNPHFLFNSFNTLISIIEDDKDLAVEYVEKLSDFFRNIVTYKDKDLIPLKEEIKTAATYFFLQQKRYGKNLDLQVELDTDDKEKQVPPMVLQLLVENAIKHNAISRETPLRIQIISHQNHLVVKNNINPKRNPEPSTGTGLQNISNRYLLLNKEKIKIENDGKMFSVSLPL